MMRDRHDLTERTNFNFNNVVGFSVVNTNNTSDHFRKNNHVTVVGLDSVGLFTSLAITFLLKCNK